MSGDSRLEALIERHAAGDESALGELLDLYYDRVTRIVRVKMFASLRRKLDPEEVVHSAMAVAIQKFSDFEYREPASVINWLAQIAMNKLRDKKKYFDAACRDIGVEVAMQALAQSCGATASGYDPSARDTLPPDKVAKEERRLAVDDCLRELSDDHRAVILHRDYEGGSWEYVGWQTGQTAEAARMKHKRAKDALRRALQRRGP